MSSYNVTDPTFVRIVAYINICFTIIYIYYSFNCYLCCSDNFLVIIHVFCVVIYNIIYNVGICLRYVRGYYHFDIDK